jgi:hypothetical protein
MKLSKPEDCLSGGFVLGAICPLKDVNRQTIIRAEINYLGTGV